jgi:hydroxymethylbilane synthase
MVFTKMEQKKIILGTRSSKLAVWQAETIGTLLQKAGFVVSYKKYETKGDKILNVSLQKVGSKGLFTEELEQDLLSGTIDLAIHSAKDMQATLPEDLEIIAFHKRENPGDVIISLDPNFKLGEKAGQKIGTSAVRRVSFLNYLYPDVQTVQVRGNLQTRFKKLEEGQADALMLAHAGVKRMGMEQHIVNQLPLDQFVPPTGQGSIAIQAKAHLDPELKNILRQVLNHKATEHCLLLERAFLKCLDGGCSIPSFAHAYFLNDGKVKMTSGLVSAKKLVKEEATFLVEEGIQPAITLAKRILENGGREILENARIKG